MAERPPTRRAGTQPPPIPRAPVAPAPALTDVVPTSELEDGEDTRDVEAPDAEALVERMLELVATEAAALLGGDDEARLADLNVRTALASWDALHQADEAMRFLELAESHPLAGRLRFAAALASGEPAALAALEPRITEGALAVELAEAWLWRHGRADRAAAIADPLLASGGLDPVTQAQVIELAVLAHATLGAWPRVVELRRAALGATAAPSDVAATAALMVDRGDDPTGALALCLDAVERSPGPHGDPLGWLRVIDVAIVATEIVGGDQRLALLSRRLELLEALRGGELEALATRHALASEHERRGDLARAHPAWAAAAADPEATSPGSARRVATLRLAWSADAAGDRTTALAAHRRLATETSATCVEVATSHAWRALELAAVTGDASVAELAHVVADAAEGVAAERWLDLADVAAPTAATVARFEERGGGYVRWAAAIAERRAAPDDSPTKAIQLWHRAAAESTVTTTRDHAVRLLRDGDVDALAEAYAVCARGEADARAAAALWCARGVVDLARGDFVEAEESLQQAAALDPRDPFCRAALAAVYRAGKRHEALAATLGELATTLTSRDARAAAAREHAELLEIHLGDPSAARAALEQMLAERPDDVEAMLALAKLCDRGALLERASELRRRAVEQPTSPARRAEIWLELARGEEARGQPAAAIEALVKAVAHGHPDARREQLRLHREAGQLAEALDVARAELATDPPLQRRMELQRDLAWLLAELGREPEAIVAAYLDVLSIEPDQTEALVGIEPAARQLGLWDELARAFRGAPATPRNLEVLADALSEIAEWSELAEVRRRQLEAASDPATKAARASELATLYDRELGDADGAIRMWRVAHAAQPDDTRHGELLRLLRAAARWADVAAALEQALSTGRPLEIERQVELLRELAEIRAKHLGRPADAITAYQGVLERLPMDPTATAALEALYEVAGNDVDLATVLEGRARGTEDVVARAALFARIAALKTNQGDVDGALAAFRSAFAADPANRDVFTAMERACYKAERWPVAMQLYDDAIVHVESGASRSYRLGDLYARRGNVQLNFLAQPGAAIVSYQKVVEVDSKPAAAIKVLEELCAQRHDWRPLISAYERRADTQRDPARRTDALRAAAKLVDERLADEAASIQLQRKLLMIDPMDAGAVSTLERYYEARQDKAGLVDLLKLRLEHVRGERERVELIQRIARMSEEGARDVDNAIEHYQKLLELQPENREALDALGRIYESTEQWTEYVEVTRRLIKVTTDRNTKALLYFRCGSVMEAKFAREVDAIRYYDAAIKASSACLPAVHGLRDLYRRREEWPRVIETLELEVKLWQEDNERAGVFAQIGRVFETQLGDPERAMTYYESALEVDPECLPANQALFEHFFALGEWDRAQPIANALAQKAMREGDPSTRSEFYLKRGIVARMSGDPRAAAESFIVALEIRPTNTAALDALGVLARERPEAWDYEGTYRELDKLYKKRDDADALLARVHVGRAAIIESEGDLDQAAEHYRQALELAPDDLTVLSSLVDFHADMRHWAQAIAAIDEFIRTGTVTPGDRLAARMRQAQIHADGEMDCARAIEVLGEVIRTEPDHQDAYYELAQQCFLAGRYPEARTAIDRVIELASAPGQPLSASALARYYYYKGRILDAAGDARAAAPQYRRATEYDPGYAPPVLALARRAADAGDQRQAETLLIEAAHAAMAHGGPPAAVPLQRGLARILLASGDRPEAIEAYRGILNVDPDSASDRVALAEIYAVDDPQRAIGELRKVLDRDIHHAPAYRLLASFYNRIGDVERANRVLTALDLLGFAEEADRATALRVRAARTARPLHRALADDHRERWLLTPHAHEPLGEVFAVFSEELTAMVPPPPLGENLRPAQTEPRLMQLATEIGFLHQIDPEIFIGDNVPGLAVVTSYPRRLLVLDRTLLDEPEATLRFVFGYAYEAIRGGYAVLLQLGARHRRELAALLRALIAADAEMPGPAADLVNHASEQAQEILERHAGIRDLDAGAWIDGMIASAKRAGLFSCDDFAAAIWAVSRLSGEQLGSHEDAVALGAVLGGPDLVRFYLSDDYQQLRDALAT